MEEHNMTPKKLIRAYKKSHPDGHFFDDDTLRFFGEKVGEMEVLKNTIPLAGHEGRYYVLSTVQHNHPMGPTKQFVCFNVDTFEPINV